MYAITLVVERSEQVDLVVMCKCSYIYSIEWKIFRISVMLKSDRSEEMKANYEIYLCQLRAKKIKEVRIQSIKR